MRVAIFGASGRTGNLLTARCLAAGYTVAALVRTPARFPYRDKVRVVVGSAFDPLAVADTLSGADVVLSALGARSLRKEDVLEQAIPVIVQGMRNAGLRRIITLGGASAVPDSLKQQPRLVAWFLRTFLYNRLLKWPSHSQRAQLAVLSSSGLDWTMVMPPMLTGGHARGNYRVDGAALPRTGMRISREDVADFMMRQIPSREWVGRGVYIAW